MKTLLWHCPIVTEYPKCGNNKDKERVNTMLNYFLKDVFKTGIFNPFVTAHSLVCGRRFDHAKDIILDVVLRMFYSENMKDLRYSKIAPPSYCAFIER